MAVTFAHPAAAIPLRKLGLLMSPLIIGSISPDFEFYIRFSPDRVIAHTWPGVFLFCIPVSLALLWLYHSIIKHAMISLCPHGHQRRLLCECGQFRFFPVKRFFLILVSVFIGAATHLFWDSWTHADGYFVRMFPALSSPLHGFLWGDIRVYFLLQCITSVIGLLIMALAYKKWYRQAPLAHSVYRVSNARKALITVSMAVTAITGGFVCGFIASHPGLHPEKTIISAGVVGFISSFIAAVIFFAFIFSRTRTVPLKVEEPETVPR
jgi:hypothetical protein